jgi:hypothetical protein
MLGDYCDASGEWCIEALTARSDCTPGLTQARALSMLLLMKPLVLESQLLSLPTGCELCRRSPGELGPPPRTGTAAVPLPPSDWKRSYGLPLDTGDRLPPRAAMPWLRAISEHER